MNALAIKEVEFNGTMLRATQDEIGRVFIGLRWICDNIGLSIDQSKRQMKNVREDLVISKGVSNMTLLTNGGAQEVLCLDIDYLPLWLAKISITPAMKRENPELVNNLIIYQLKAKDVLAQAFLKKEHLSIEEKIDKLMEGMGNLAKYIIDMKDRQDEFNKKYSPLLINNTALPNQKSLLPQSTSSFKNSENDRSSWRKNVNTQVKQLLALDHTFADSKAVLKFIYRYMDKNYGICLSQKVFDYQKYYDLDVKPSTFDVIYDDETTRSIFSAVLLELIDQVMPTSNITKEISLDDIILPLVEKFQDNSRYSCSTYRRVYRHMAERYNISWKNQMTRYINSGHAHPSKKDIILTKPKLQKQFKTSVSELLQN